MEDGGGRREDGGWRREGGGWWVVGSFGISKSLGV
jgi:hypothetical protein